MTNEQTVQSIHRIAYIGEDKNLHFAIGYNLGHVDPMYMYSEDRYEYSYGSQEILKYVDYTGKEVTRKVTCLVSGSVNWLDDSKSEFDKKKVKPIVDKYLDKNVHVISGRFKVYGENKFEISFSNGAFYQGKIKAAQYSTHKRFYFNGEGCQKLRNTLAMALRGAFQDQAVHIGTTSLGDDWEDALIELNSETPVYFYVKNHRMYMDTNLKTYQALEVVSITRDDATLYKTAVRDALVEAAFENISIPSII